MWTLSVSHGHHLRCVTSTVNRVEQWRLYFLSCPRIVSMSFVSIIFHYEIKLGSRRAPNSPWQKKEGDCECAGIHQRARNMDNCSMWSTKNCVLSPALCNFAHIIVCVRELWIVLAATLSLRAAPYSVCKIQEPETVLTHPEICRTVNFHNPTVHCMATAAQDGHRKMVHRLFMAVLKFVQMAFALILILSIYLSFARSLTTVVSARAFLLLCEMLIYNNGPSTVSSHPRMFC